MVCHLQYFNVAGYFNSLGYVNNMGLDTKQKAIFGIPLTDEEATKLEKLIMQSDKDSQAKKLPGIVELIQYVEDLQDKYGHAGNHRHSTENIVTSMCNNKKLVEMYGLEKLAQKYTSHVQTQVQTKKQIKQK